MKKVFCVLMAAVLLLATGCSSNSAETEDNTVRIGCEFAYVPYNWEEDVATEYNMPIENQTAFTAMATMCKLPSGWRKPWARSLCSSRFLLTG